MEIRLTTTIPMPKRPGEAVDLPHRKNPEYIITDSILYRLHNSTLTLFSINSKTITFSRNLPFQVTLMKLFKNNIIAFVSRETPNCIHFYDIMSQKIIRTLTGEGQISCLHLVNHYCLSVTRNNILWIWDVEISHCTHTINIENSKKIIGIASDPSGHFFAINIFKDPMIQIRNFKTGKLYATVYCQEPASGIALIDDTLAIVSLARKSIKFLELPSHSQHQREISCLSYDTVSLYKDYLNANHLPWLVIIYPPLIRFVYINNRLTCICEIYYGERKYTHGSCVGGGTRIVIIDVLSGERAHTLSFNKHTADIALDVTIAGQTIIGIYSDCIRYWELPAHLAVSYAPAIFPTEEAEKIRFFMEFSYPHNKAKARFGLPDSFTKNGSVRFPKGFW